MDKQISGFNHVVRRKSTKIQGYPMQIIRNQVVFWLGFQAELLKIIKTDLWEVHVDSHVCAIDVFFSFSG